MDEINNAKTDNKEIESNKKQLVRQKSEIITKDCKDWQKLLELANQKTNREIIDNKKPNCLCCTIL